MGTKRRFEVRYELFKGSDPHIVEIDEEEESILNVEHQAGVWWVYIARWVDNGYDYNLDIAPDSAPEDNT